MKTLLLLSTITFFSFIASAQKNTNQADNYYADLNFPKAIDAYHKAIEKDKSNQVNLETAIKLANSYFYLNDFTNARKWYNKAYSMQGDNMDESLFLRYIAVMKSCGEIQKSNDLLKSYYSEQPKRLKMLSYQKDALDSLENLVETVTNAEINSEYSDFSPYFYGNDVIFASSRPTENSESIYEANNQPYLNLFIATQNKNSGRLSNIRSFNAEMNSDFHDATLCFNPDQTYVYFSRNTLNHKLKLDTDENGTSNLVIMRGVISQDGISDLQELEFNDPAYSCSHPVVSSDGKYLYFTSDMPGGFGETDLYYAEIFNDGTTGLAVNLGEHINTAGREMFPSIVGDSLYFASNGHYGLGGLDLFVSKIGGPTNLSIPENIGSPINSPQDDFGFIMNSENNSGYFSSNRKGGKGDDDIYYFKMKELPKNIEFSGIVLTDKTRKIIPNAKIELFDVFNDPVLEASSDENGNFDIVLPCNSQFKAVFSKEGFSTETLEVITPVEPEPNDDNEVLLANFNEIVEKEGDIEKIKVDPIYFDYDKWEITAQAEVELQKVLYAMERFPEMTIKIESHTDSRGSDSYNKKLSDNRAKSTMEYLISEGIEAYRIESAVGYGEEKPRNKCINGVRCSEEEHFVNRRSDFVILTK